MFMNFSVVCTRGVAVAIFSFRFHILYFPVYNRLNVSYLTKHENQIVFNSALKGCRGIVFIHCVRMGGWVVDKSLSRLCLRNCKV